MARPPNYKIVSLHSDGTECTHRLTSSGKARDPESGCTGRDGYRATCKGTGCNWSQTGNPRTSLEYAADTHRRTHQA